MQPVGLVLDTATMNIEPNISTENVVASSSADSIDYSQIFQNASTSMANPLMSSNKIYVTQQKSQQSHVSQVESNILTENNKQHRSQRIHNRRQNSRKLEDGSRSSQNLLQAQSINFVQVCIFEIFIS